MKFHRIAAAAIATLGTLAVAALVEAGVFHQKAHGTLSAQGVRAKGRFHLESNRNEKGKFREQLHLDAAKLDTKKDAQGNPPVYHLFLVTKGGTESDFGYMRLGRNGQSAFDFNSRRDAYPAGVTSLTTFGDGKIQIRHDADVVIEGAIPDLVASGETSVAAGAEIVIADRNRLAPPTASDRARGALDARFTQNGKRTNERVRLNCNHLPGAASPYSVVAIAADLSETTLFSDLRPRGPNGEFHRELNTRGGYTIPGGGVFALSGLDVQVRDKDGNAVLSGKFPDVVMP